MIRVLYSSWEMNLLKGVLLYQGKVNGRLPHTHTHTCTPLLKDHTHTCTHAHRHTHGSNMNPSERSYEVIHNNQMHVRQYLRQLPTENAKHAFTLRVPPQKTQERSR